MTIDSEAWKCSIWFAKSRSSLILMLPSRVKCILVSISWVVHDLDETSRRTTPWTWGPTRQPSFTATHGKLERSIPMWNFITCTIMCSIIFSWVFLMCYLVEILTCFELSGKVTNLCTHSSTSSPDGRTGFSVRAVIGIYVSVVLIPWI